MTNFLVFIATGFAIYKTADKVLEDKIQSSTNLFKSIGYCLKWLAICQFAFSIADIADSITLMCNAVTIMIQVISGNAV